MAIDNVFETLTVEQKEKVQDAFGTQKHSCAGCATYLGKTELGEHTYFWHYGASDGYVALPVVGKNPHYDYDSGNITVAGREFTSEGVEIIPPTFEFLVHVDLRVYSEIYRDLAAKGFASDEEELATAHCCGGGSFLPEHAAKRLGVKSGIAIPWVSHFRLAPWELTEEITRAALAITICKDGKKIIVL